MIYPERVPLVFEANPAGGDTSDRCPDLKTKVAARVAEKVANKKILPFTSWNACMSIFGRSKALAVVFPIVVTCQISSLLHTQTQLFLSRRATDVFSKPQTLGMLLPGANREALRGPG